MAKRALIIEDSPDVSKLLEKVLQREGYDPLVADSVESGTVIARDAEPDLVILDLSLPDGDGIEACREIRSFSDAYIIMVTSRDDEVDKLLGLGVGADDYVTKPFSPRELGARIRAVSRRPRAEAPSNQVRTFGDFVMDVSARELSITGDAIRLTKTEFDLLEVLSASPRRTFTRQQLIDQVWGDWFGDGHILNVHVGNLRRKLSAVSPNHSYIETVRGVGYRFHQPEA